MLWRILSIGLSIFLLTTARASPPNVDDYRTNSSKYFYSILANALENMGTTCITVNLCQLTEKFKSTNLRPPVTRLNRMTKNNNEVQVQERSYYGAVSPAFYPAFDPISILASLAFLAFLLQSFAALFDRSRSILPTVVSSRDGSSAENQTPDPLELILRALDEYELLNDINENSDKIFGKS